MPKLDGYRLFSRRLDNQQGIVHILLLILLVAGIIAGVYLVQHRTNLLPKAGGGISGPITSTTSFILSAPPQVSIGGENEVRVKVLVRSDISAANLFTAKLNFPADLLQVQSIETDTGKECPLSDSASGSNPPCPSGNSFVKNWVEKSYDNKAGTISLIGGVPNPGYQTSYSDPASFMADVTFKVLKQGTATISFDDTSSIYSNVDNINILTIKEPINLSITSSAMTCASYPDGPKCPSGYACQTDKNSLPGALGKCIPKNVCQTLKPPPSGCSYEGSDCHLVCPGKASLSLDPAGGVFNKSCNFSLNVNVDTGGAQTEGTDAVLFYDPSKLTATSVTKGTIYANYPPANIDSQNGKITISGMSGFNTTFAGKGILATINFTVPTTAASGATEVSFDFDPNNKARSNDSNIVQSGTLVDILNSARSGMYAVGTEGSCQTSTPVPISSCDLSGDPRMTDSCASCLINNESTTKTLVDRVKKLGSDNGRSWGNCSNTQLVGQWCSEINPDGCRSLIRQTCWDNCGGATPPPVPHCTLTSASWSPLSTAQGSEVRLNVTGNSACANQQVAFRVVRNGVSLNNGNDVTTQPVPITLNSSGNGAGTWIAEYNPLISLLPITGANPQYYFVALASNASSVDTRDNLLTVTPASSPSLVSVTPSQANAGGQVTFSWYNIPNANVRDWFSIIAADKPTDPNDPHYRDTVLGYFMNCVSGPEDSTHQPPSSPRPSGNCSVPVPANLTPGSYVIRLYSAGTWNMIAHTSAFTVAASNTTSGSGDANGDGKIDLTDLSILLTDYNKNQGIRTGIDINGDGLVNSFDFSLMRNLLIKNGLIKGS